MTTCAASAIAASAEHLPADVRQLLEARLPAATDDVRWHARSGTRLDTGAWLARAPLHVVVCGDRLALVAAGPRPFVLDLPAAALRDAVYNHVTGELSFPHGAAGPAAPPVRLDPLVARGLVALAPSVDHSDSSPGTCSHA